MSKFDPAEFRIADDGEHVEFRHPCSANGGLDPDPAFAALPIGKNGWSIEQREPLTVRPSINCKRCGLHGWITDGRWESV
ncbi:DUF6527 family protein [Amycolatopsis sp. NPDC051372]|uniref:DUF6527 family protein n=1 Tax=Amycolatopsis sp. NPDC051372 TaxID=3155669 RepID=UPI00342A159C